MNHAPWIAVLDACIETLDGCAGHFRTVADSVNGADVEAMRRMNTFASECLRAARLLLTKSLPDQAMIVTRSAYEAGVRMLWAARANEGWKRLRRYFAEQDQKLAKALLKDERVGTHAAEVHAERGATIEDDGSSSMPAAPDLAGMLREIAKEDAPLKPAEQLEDPAEHYARFYRIASGIAHGHPGMLREETADASFRHSVILATYATKAVVLANVHFAARIGLQPWPDEDKRLRYIDELLLKAAKSDDAPA